MSEPFHGGQKQHLNHFLLTYEQVIMKACLLLVPSWMSTVHLTMMTVIWSAGIVFFGWIAVYNLKWLWGFYMDHILDYVFVCAIIAGYSFLLPSYYAPVVLFALTVIGGFMVHVFLDFGVTHDFKISFDRLGPTEGRYAVIALNTAIIVWGRDFFVAVFPLITMLLFVFLLKVIYCAQKTYMHTDKEELRNHERPS